MSTATTLARPYAHALFRMSEQNAEALQAWSATLALLASVSLEPKVAALLDSPSQKAAAKAAVLVEVFADELPAQGATLLRILADNNRLLLLPVIREAFETLKREAKGVLDVELSTAFKLSEDEITALQLTLEKQTGRKANIRKEAIKVSKDLLGGVVIRANDRLIDASLRGRLRQLEKELARV